MSLRRPIPNDPFDLIMSQLDELESQIEELKNNRAPTVPFYDSHNWPAQAVEGQVVTACAYAPTKVMRTLTEGTWQINHYRPPGAFLDNGLKLLEPFEHVVTTAGVVYPGVTYTIGLLPACTDIVVQLTEATNPTGFRGPFTNTSLYAHFLPGFVDGEEWMIGWEDGGIIGLGDTDFDYNDSYTHIYRI
jgi:hypothetical protein